LGFYHPKTKKKPGTARDNDGEVRLQDPRLEEKKKKQTVGLRRDLVRSGKASAGDTPARFLLLSLFFFLFPSSFSFLSSLIGCCMVQNGFVHFFSL
jgi:ribosomal protein S30